MLHDCLNPIGGVLKSQRQVIVYTHERTFLRSMAHCGSVMELLPDVDFDHTAHRRGDEQNLIQPSILSNKQLGGKKYGWAY